MEGIASLPKNSLWGTNVGPQEQALVPIRKASILLTSLAPHGRSGQGFSVALEPVIELALVDQAGFELAEIRCLCLPSAEIKDMLHHHSVSLSLFFYSPPPNTSGIPFTPQHEFQEDTPTPVYLPCLQGHSSGYSLPMIIALPCPCQGLVTSSEDFPGYVRVGQHACCCPFR